MVQTQRHSMQIQSHVCKTTSKNRKGIHPIDEERKKQKNKKTQNTFDFSIPN